MGETETHIFGGKDVLYSVYGGGKEVLKLRIKVLVVTPTLFSSLTKRFPDTSSSAQKEVRKETWKKLWPHLHLFRSEDAGKSRHISFIHRIFFDLSPSM